MEYKFDKVKHIHTLDGKTLTGCTTVLSVLAKPALIQWSANMAVEYIVKVASPYYGELNSEEQLKDTYLINGKQLEEAKTAHRRKKEEAGQKGTDIHFEIEKLVASVIGAWGGIIDKDTKSEIPQVQHFMDWAVKNKVKFLESEKNIYSQSLWVGGIVDIVCEIDGEVWIADVKTGSGIYPEHFWQMAGYQIMLEEMGMGGKVKGHIVLNLKKTGEFDEKRSVSNEEAKKGFLACLEIYRIQEKFKNIIK
jgi:hypothetical protein